MRKLPEFPDAWTVPRPPHAGAEPEITISAERPSSKVIARATSGIPIREYQLSYSVSYSDLDLTTSAGADELRKRVSEAAKSACRDLDTIYPAVDPDRSCARKAAEHSKAQVDRAIALAQSQGRTSVQ